MKSSSTASSERTYLAIVGAGLFAAVVVAEVILRIFVLAVEDGRAHRVQQVYRASRPDVVLGDSHLYLPFINSDRFVNLARAGSSPHALEIVAREYFRHIDPGRVIVEASPQLFRQLMQVHRDQSHARFFSHNFGQPFVMATFEPGISRELAAISDLPALIKNAAASRGRRRTDGPIVEREAALRRELTDDERERQTRSRIQSNRPVAGVRESGSFLAYRRMLAALQARGAEICLARTPVTDLYLTLSAKDPVYVEAETALREVADEMNVRFVDFALLDLQLDVASFRNPDHLTTRAGEAYAERLERACYEGSPASEVR